MSPTSSYPPSVNALVRHCIATNPSLPILGVPDKNLEFALYSFSQLNDAATLLANFYASSNGGGLPVRSKGDTKTEMRIAIMAPSGLDYVVMEWTLLRMGFCVLFISVNNPPPAIAHLLTLTNSTHIIAHHTYAAPVQEALAQLVASGSQVQFVPQADPSVYSNEIIAQGVGPWDWRLTGEEEANLGAFIVHSSGSTGFPKPIVLSHGKSMGNFSSNFGLTGLTTLPLYHNHGHSCLYRAFLSGRPLYLFPASTLPLTQGNILKLLQSPICSGNKDERMNVQALFAVPFAYKLLAESDEGIQVLKQMELCLFGGSPCPDELGDLLVSHGVRLAGHYGLTELGQLMTSFRDFNTDPYWLWLRSSGPFAHPLIKQYADFVDQGEGKFELVVKKGWPTAVVSNNPEGGFSTKDLFTKHPEIKDAWKFVGRLDDTLVMVNGEKTSPVSIESTLRAVCPAISDAVVFGSGRSQIGALIILSPSVDPSLPPAELFKLVQSAINLANSAAPSHSQLSEEMLVFLPAGTVIPRADKGSFLRPKVYVSFKEVIDGVYRRLEGEEEEGVEKKAVGSVEEVESWLKEVVAKTAGRETGLDRETDLFEFGLDSLEAGRIRNQIQRELDLKGTKLSTNFVFDRPSISKMAAFLVALASGSKIDEGPNQVEQMLQLVEKYRNLEIPSGCKPSPSTPSLKTVVLTGATGSLGSYILDLLLSRPDVDKVYALARARNNSDAKARVLESLATRRLDNPRSKDESRLVCLASDLSQDRLGLKEEVYEEIKASVTMILHNAWSVNFNLAVGSFDPHIRGAFNLATLAVGNPTAAASFYFSSSVSAVFAWPGPGPVPEAVTEDPNVAQGMGYARSKWTVEKLCQIWSQTTPLQAGVLRIGQMVGDTVNGVWNESEAISLIFKSVDTLHALPALADQPSWLPVDYAASAILELVTIPSTSDTESRCYHVVMPKLVSWKDQILPSLARAGLKFEAVEPKEWVRLLGESKEDVSNPTRKLLEFFTNKYDPPVVANAPPAGKRYPLSTELSEKLSPSLAAAPVADDALVAKWIGSWRKTGFLN